MKSEDEYVIPQEMLDKLSVAADKESLQRDIDKLLNTYLPYTEQDRKCILDKHKKTQLRKLLEMDIRNLIGKYKSVYNGRM